MNAALYARVSTLDRGQDPELQLRDLRAYVEHRGWALTETDVYVDVGYRKKDQRPAFTRLMACASASSCTDAPAYADAELYSQSRCASPSRKAADWASRPPAAVGIETTRFFPTPSWLSFHPSSSLCSREARHERWACAPRISPIPPRYRRDHLRRCGDCPHIRGDGSRKVKK